MRSAALDIGPGERRRIVDAVAGHRHHVAFLLEELDQRQLIRRSNLAMHLIDALFHRGEF